MDKQKEVMEMYFQYDLSLNEISLNLNVSRNAVYDLIKRTTSLLEKYENKLNFLAKKEKILSLKDLSEETIEKIREIL